MEVTREIELEAAPEDVWEALTDEGWLTRLSAGDGAAVWAEMQALVRASDATGTIP